VEIQEQFHVKNIKDRMMKRIVYILTTLFLLASCSSDELVPVTQNDWTPNISRNATGGKELRIVGRKDGDTQFDKILIPASDGGNAAWKKDDRPDGDKVANSDEFIAFAPAGNGLPASIKHDGVTEYFVDHHNDKPNSFEMKPLMSQLKLHVWVEGTEGEAPQNTCLHVYTEADLDFPGKAFMNLSNRQRINLGEFVFSGELEQDGHRYKKYSMKRHIVVIPQTLPAGEEVLWFNIKDAQYYLKPEKDIQLKPGFITSLTLPVTYVKQEEEGGDSGEGGETVTPPAKKVIAIDQSTITITSWKWGETINGNIYNSDNN
jgi:hypothetical protein